MGFLRQIWIVLGAAVVAFVASWIYYMPDATERGVWRSETGGQIISLSPLQAHLYSESSASCIRQLSFPAHMKLVELSEGARVEATDDTLMLHVDGTVEPTPFTRIPTLPDHCRDPNPNAPALDTFNALWAAMDENYAFFDLHGVDWNARRALAPTGDPTLTDENLFALLSDTLEGLDDGHVQLGTPLGFYSPAEPPEWLDLDAGMTRESLTQLARETVGVPLTPVALTGIEYAVLPDGIAYVLIRHLSVDTPFGSTEQIAMEGAFANVAAEIETANTIIIDLRYNPGGSDTVSLAVASHFTGETLDAFTKTTRRGNTQSAPFTARVQPYDSSPLEQPVLVLTSELTASAAEILTMALRELPQVTTMGHATSGGLSDILGFKLPNGWDLGLSHQTYRTMDGTSYEAIGIPPDIEFRIETAPLQRGEDLLLQAALERARAG